MNKVIFDGLLIKKEGKTVDFKKQPYDFSGITQIDKEEKDAKFIKDIISFANTIRNESAYIIMGIEEDTQTKQLILHGITQHLDDAMLQQKIKDKTNPVPHFYYKVFEDNNKQFGIIEIPVYSYLEPVKCIKRMKGIEPGQIYIRRGSSNSESTEHEKIQIYDWLRTLDPTRKNASSNIHNGSGDIVLGDKITGDKILGNKVTK